MPRNAQQIAFIRVARIEFAAIGAVQRLADSMRQVRIGERHHDTVTLVPSVDDALERMLGARVGLGVADQMQNIFPMRPEEFAAQRKLAGRHAVADMLAGGAEVLCCIGYRLAPLPTSTMKHGTAFRSGRRLRPLAPCAVGIAHTLFVHPILSGLVDNSYCVSDVLT